jgi:hypothetical protein
MENMVAHSDFDGDIEIVASAFERVGIEMQKVVHIYSNRDDMPAAQAEYAIEALGAALKREVTEAVAVLIPRAYVDGQMQALEGSFVDGAAVIAAEDHKAMAGLSQRRLQRRLAHAADGLVVDALDQLDAAVEARLAPLKTEEVAP